MKVLLERLAWLGLDAFYFLKRLIICPILIIHSASGDKSAAKYCEMSAILGL